MSELQITWATIAAFVALLYGYGWFRNRRLEKRDKERAQRLDGHVIEIGKPFAGYWGDGPDDLSHSFFTLYDTTVGNAIGSFWLPRAGYRSGDCFKVVFDPQGNDLSTGLDQSLQYLRLERI